MLFDKLKSNNRIPLHMPGHKRNIKLLGNNLPYEIDITEIEGFDNLHAPTGVIKKVQDKLGKIYRSNHSYALINGSTVGILAGVLSIVKENDTVLLARNCHKSVYNAIELAKANAVYIEPRYDEYGIALGVTTEQVKEKLSDEIKLIVITSPSYEGVKSDLYGICKLAHKNNIPVLIDAAHGAHFFDEYTCADIVITSLHKTLPALTQCAAANIYGDLVDYKEFQIKLSMLETSSPSYVLMTSIDECADFILNNKVQFGQYNNILDKFYNIKLKYLKLLKYDDRGKLVIFTGNTNLTGFALADLLRNDYNIEIEMTSKDYIVAMTSVCDTEENLIYFKNALVEIDRNLNASEFYSNITLQLPVKAKASYEIEKKAYYPLDKSVGKVSAEYIWAYPPGVPIVVPGEIISMDIVDYVKKSIENSVNIQSTYGEIPEKIYCQD
ncbi:MAG: aminotransferase class I/II-fold pyridoxal phosphate-dependent enzyme [Ruminococcus sp.]|nr:aminotransferase class I/II-fold pyridoxal phosphate-dependent enzyme [Ruminococcus sp.]